MKVAPLMRAFVREATLQRPVLVHTGQHYDLSMNERLFEDLQLPAPDVNLEVGSGTHAQQTAEVMRRFEPVLERYAPCCVVVVGDVNSTLACSLVAVKRHVPVVHVEAGLRSFDRRMPEEINRLLTDQIADLLFTTERSAHENLVREGVPGARVRFVGNVMIDSLRAHLPRAPQPAQVLERARVPPGTLRHPAGFAVATLHRPSNVDTPRALEECLDILREVSRRLPLVLPLHPRTRANLERFGLSAMLTGERIALLPPQGYLEMLGLMSQATLVLMVRRDRALALSTVDAVLRTGGKRGRTPELWDGRAAERIAAHLVQWLSAMVPAAA
jgi:UDP-N-acetylglucosamine 2-epimerase (non-hydrolysing)